MPNPRDEGEIPLEGRLAMIETSLKDEMLPNLRSLFEVPVDLPEHLESYKEVLEEAGGEIVELFSYPYKVIPFWKNMRVPRSWFEAFSDEVEPIFVVLGHFNTILENPETLGNGVSVDIYEENTGSAGMSGSSKKGKHPRGNSPDAPKTSTVVKFTSKESRISIGEVPVHGFSLIINHTPNPKGRGDVFTPLSFSMKFSDANGKEIMRSGVDAHRVGSQERDKTRAALIEVDSIPFPENSLFNAPCSKIETHHLPVKSLNALESPERDTAFQTLLAILAKNMADRLDALSGEKGSGILVAPEKVNLLRKPFRALMRVGRPKEEVSVVEGEPASAEETHFKNVLSSMEGLDSSIVSPEQYQTFIDGVFGGVEGISSWILGDSPVEASLPEDALDVLKDPSIAKIVAEKPEDFCFPNDLKEYERLMLSVEENLGFSMDSDMETIIALQTRLQQLFFIRRVLTTDFESRGKAENPVIEVSPVSTAESLPAETSVQVLSKELNVLLEKGILPEGLTGEIEALSHWLLFDDTQGDNLAVKEFSPENLASFLEAFPDIPESRAELLAETYKFPQEDQENFPSLVDLMEELREPHPVSVGRLFMLKQMLQ